jgi:hypothetical protein
LSQKGIQTREESKLTCGDLPLTKSSKKKKKNKGVVVNHVNYHSTIIINRTSNCSTEQQRKETSRSRPAPPKFVDRGIETHATVPDIIEGLLWTLF